MKDLVNALSAVSNSLTRIVGPAVADDDPLAQQQLALSLAYLGLIRERLPLAASRERFELEEDLRLARVAAPLVSEWSAALLRELASTGERVLESRSEGGREIRETSARIRAVVSEEFATIPEEAAPALESAVLSTSRATVAMDRAWHLPMGFDPDPGSVRPLADILDARKGASA